jgi:hypothetical protein
MTGSGRTRPGQAPQKGSASPEPSGDPGAAAYGRLRVPDRPGEGMAPRPDDGPGDDPDTRYDDYVPV